MDVSSASSAATAAVSSAPAENKIAQLQIALLRKSLDSQQEQTTELLKMMEGKGRVVDLRV